MTARVVAFVPELIALTGSTNAAILLSQIMYWHRGSKLRVRRDGHLWLAKSRQDMCGETGLSLEQYKHAIKVLARKGLVVLERGMFNNRVTPYIRLGGKSLNGRVKNPQPIEEFDANLVRTEITTETTHRLPAASGGGPVKASEVQQRLQAKRDEVPTTLVVKSAAALASWWQRLVPRYNTMPVLPGGLKVKPLTRGEYGMLSHYIRTVGSADSYSVMLYCVSHWSRFRLEVQQKKGESVPEWPRVAFLLKHYDVAIHMQQTRAGDVQSTALGTSRVRQLSDAEQDAKILSGG